MTRALSRLGKRIRALRLDRKLTQEQAAEAAKLDEKHWQDIEGGRTNPTVATLAGIARALDVVLCTLFEDDEDAASTAGEKRPGTPPSSPALLPAASAATPAPRSRARPRTASPRSRK